MTTATTPRRARRGLKATAAATIAAGAFAFSAMPANAAPININYDVNGTTHIASTNSNITLGPAVMAATIAGAGSFTGNMVLPGTRTEFKMLGFIPVSADVNFEPVGTGATTGNLVLVNRMLELHSTTQYNVRLSNIKAVGLPLFAGSQCRTVNPVTIAANTPTGERFIPGQGGRLTGTYAIGNFQNCGLNTWLLNQIIPGSGNTVELNLANPQAG